MKPPAPAWKSARALALSAFTAATAFSSMALASAAVPNWPCAKAAVAGQGRGRRRRPRDFANHGRLLVIVVGSSPSDPARSEHANKALLWRSVRAYALPAAQRCPQPPAVSCRRHASPARPPSPHIRPARPRHRPPKPRPSRGKSGKPRAAPRGRPARRDQALGPRPRRGQRAVSAAPAAASPVVPEAPQMWGRDREGGLQNIGGSSPTPNPSPQGGGGSTLPALRNTGPPSRSFADMTASLNALLAKPHERSERAREVLAAAADARRASAGLRQPADVHAAPAAAAREVRGRHRLQARVGVRAQGRPAHRHRRAGRRRQRSTSATRCCSASPARARPSPWPR